MRLHASKLGLPFPTSSSHSASSNSPVTAVSSLLFEPSTSSLALMLADSSALLYPSLSPARSPAVVPPPSTAACFLRFLPSDHVLFLSAGPLSAGSSIQLRAWILLPRGGGTRAAFTPARLDYRNDRNRSVVSLALRHGHTVRLVGSVNAFIVHSAAANQIWILAARMAAAEEATVHLVKCAVIELTLPIYSITLSMGHLLLGEMNGVRVFPLRPLIKGKIAKSSALGHKIKSASIEDLRKKNLPNGPVNPRSVIKNSLGSESGNRCDCKGSGQDSLVEERTDGCSIPNKLKIARVRQDSTDLYSSFTAIKFADLQNCKGRTGPPSLKAVCVYVLSHKQFLILDSSGDLHVLSLNDRGMVSEPLNRLSISLKDAHLGHLNNIMEVQLLAVLADNSSKTQLVWLSDGRYSIYLISLDDTEATISENDKDECKKTSAVLSVVGVIFTSEKIQEIIPISSNSCLVLCQGKIPVRPNLSIKLSMPTCLLYGIVPCYDRLADIR